ncbi:MAG TPA: S8 family serine peptidase [Aridibacter sp.]|nr:S8 family serine peptidase [Aridibacter sp.]
MNSKKRNPHFPPLVLAAAVLALLLSVLRIDAAVLSPDIESGIDGAADSVELGLSIIAFDSPDGLKPAHLSILEGVGITSGETFPTLGMVAAPLTAGQVRALAANPAVRSIWSNDRLYYYMEQARILAGVDKLRIDAGFTYRNGGMPVSGNGNFSVMVIDSGVDATHADLQFGPKVIQNVQTVVAAGTLDGFTPNVAIENVPNTDQTVGHGTHCAGIIGGTGVRSGGQYAGVAPGARIIGSGLGAAIFVVNGLAAWEWGLSNQFRYNIRVISNSYGSSGPFEPDNPITIASKMAYDRNIAIVFAAANAGPAKGTLNSYAKAPWVIGVAAGSKEGELADFSSRGLPKSERLGNEDPLDDFDAPTITAPGTGRVFESNLERFNSDVISTRSTLNLTSNGTTADTEIAPGLIPFYTQISGTSMATPFVAGTIALMLEADPALTPDEIKQILVETATRMPGYEDHEVGAGYLNAHAAVDKVFNRGKSYSGFQEIAFNLPLTEEALPAENFVIDFDPASTPGTDSANARPFTVAEGMNVLDIYANVDAVLEPGTGNLVGIIAHAPDGTTYSSGIEYPYPLGSEVRQIIVDNPQPGTWHLEVRGARGLTAVPGVSLPTSGAALPGPVSGTIIQKKILPPDVPDISGHASEEDILFALKSRLMDVFSDGSFRPDQNVTRGDLLKLLVINANVRQSLSSSPRFTDISGDLARMAEAAAVSGPTLRDHGFGSTGLLNVSGDQFEVSATVGRLDTAVALVKALGHDPRARDLAGSVVTFQGVPLTDNGQIPPALRGYVQLALDKGLFEAFPAQVIQTGPGQFQVLPGPRFEPGTAITRADFAALVGRYKELFTTGG